MQKPRIGMLVAGLVLVSATAIGAPASEAALRAFILNMQTGHPDYESLTPQFAEAVHKTQAEVQGTMTGYGSLKSITYVGPTMLGVHPMDEYEVEFTGGKAPWKIGVDAEGKIIGIRWEPLRP